MNTSAKQLLRNLCPDLIESVEDQGGLRYIVSAIRYADGDSVVVYLKGDVLSDLGTTAFKLPSVCSKLSEGRIRQIGAICKAHGVKMVGNEFQKPKPRLEEMGDAVREFSHALSRVWDAVAFGRQRDPAGLEHHLTGLLTLRVAPKRQYTRNWCFETRDPERAFPVDFRVNGVGQARHIFHVGSQSKCDRVAAVCNFLRVEHAYTPTLAVVRDDLELGPHFLDRLQMSTDQIAFGFEGHQDEIVDFALSGA